MKTLTFCLFFLSFNVSSHVETESQKHEKFKKGTIEALEMKITDLNILKKCYERSANKVDSNKCRDEMQAREKMKLTDLKAKRKALKDSLEERLPKTESKGRGQD